MLVALSKSSLRLTRGNPTPRMQQATRRSYSRQKEVNKKQLKNYNKIDKMATLILKNKCDTLLSLKPVKPLMVLIRL